MANTDNLGTVVSAMTAGISDADSGALKGIAVSAVDSSNGSWQSTTDGGLTWLSLSDVSAFSTRLLKGNEADHRIRFIPHANYNGPATITYHAWDQTSSAHGNVQGHSEACWLGLVLKTTSTIWLKAERMAVLYPFNPMVFSPPQFQLGLGPGNILVSSMEHRRGLTSPTVPR